MGNSFFEKRNEEVESSNFRERSLEFFKRSANVFVFFVFILILIVSLFNSEPTDRNDIHANPKRNYDNEVTENQTFPDLEGTKEMNYEWNYEGETYRLDLTLHDSVYEYYQNQPDKYYYTGALPANWAEEYYEMFLKTHDKDNTFSKLTSKLEDIGIQRGLSDDQVLELTIAFVQSIPYDYKRASSTKPEKRYPYEVLYDKKGICSGKSFLATLLTKELGYGVALLEFEFQEHIALGVKCTKNYSSYDNSGYCFTEVTSPGWKIGIGDLSDIEDISMESFSGVQISQIGSPTSIFEIADGKTYTGIVETIKTKNRIEKLNTDLDQLEARISRLREKLDSYKASGNYTAYNNLVPTYNNLVGEQRRKAQTYNNLIREFRPSN